MSQFIALVSFSSTTFQILCHLGTQCSLHTPARKCSTNPLCWYYLLSIPWKGIQHKDVRLCCSNLLTSRAAGWRGISGTWVLANICGWQRPSAKALEVGRNGPRRPAPGLSRGTPGCSSGFISRRHLNSWIFAVIASHGPWVRWGAEHCDY